VLGDQLRCTLRTYERSESGDLRERDLRVRTLRARTNKLGPISFVRVRQFTFGVCGTVSKSVSKVAFEAYDFVVRRYA
jgi:hypothetical protein